MVRQNLAQFEDRVYKPAEVKQVITDVRAEDGQLVVGVSAVEGEGDSITGTNRHTPEESVRVVDASTGGGDFDSDDNFEDVVAKNQEKAD